MQYISSFIHVPSTASRMVAIDVNTIDTISGRDHAVHVYTSGGLRPLEVSMSKEKLIDLVEDKRRELWMNERAAQIESSKLMIDLIECVHALKPDIAQRAKAEINRLTQELEASS